MSTEVTLLILRIISALLLLLFLGSIYLVVWRDQRQAASEIDMKRQSYGNLVKLQEIDGQYLLTGETYILKPITSLGRSPTNTVQIEDNFSSGEHALVTLRQGQWWLEDRNSRNGTFLNNIQVKQPVVIADGDIIGIGHVRLRMDLEDRNRS